MKTNAKVFSAVLLLGVVVSTAWWAIAEQSQEASLPEVTVYKSPTCGCCKKWVNHLEDNGFNVKAINKQNMGPIKNRFGVRRNLASCHTAVVDGYVIEGHVPASSIKRLLTERPNIEGLTVPGMLMGTPGMEGPRKQPYQVLTFDAQGNTSVYDRF